MTINPNTLTDIETISVIEDMNLYQQDPNMLDISNGPIARTTLKLSIPIFVSQLVAFANTMVDTYFVSLIDRNSTALISGVGLVAAIFFLFYNIASGLFLATSSVTARGIGQKDEDVIKRTGDSGLLLAGGMCLLIILIGVVFGKVIVISLAGSALTAEAIRYGFDYFNYLLPGIGLVLISTVLSGILQGEGKSKQIGLSVLFSWGMNIVLNPILIFGLKMGVKGSALATSIAITSQLIYYLSLFVRGKTITKIQWKIFTLNTKIIKEIIRIGVPATIGMVLISVAYIVLNNIVGSISEVSMDAWTLVGRMDYMIIAPGLVIGMSTIPMIGQNFGQGNLKRCQDIFYVNTGLSLVIGLFLGVLYMIFAPQIFQHFSFVPGVIENCVRQVRFLTLTTICTTGMIVTGLAFQATGRPMPNLVCDVIRALIISQPLFLPLIHLTAKNMNLIFLFLGAGNIISFFICLIWALNHFKKLRSTGSLVHS
ncbi:MAG TPA: MATE family efflux transporter [Syntrophomonadaceae bacterium]|nr:MATE family efflux transporter [Syntrophomonadaceae bacterium]